ncbi:MAG: YihY/virulence factor BrkB family protein [Solirubrobacteraceae bacterium]
MAGSQTRARRKSGEQGGRAPEQPTDLPRGAWSGILKRTFQEFQADNLTNVAAALTYYGVLSIFPMLIVLVSILGLIGHSATQPLIENLDKVAPGPAKEIFTSAIQNIQKSKGTAGILFLAGLAGGLWSASGYISAFMWASNLIWDVREGRPFWKKIPIRLAVTLLIVLLLTITAVAVVLTGALAQQVGELIGVGHSAVSIWDIAKWPVLLVLVSVMIAILYYASPNVRQPGFRWVSPGSILAVVVWIIASGAFALYVASFASYNKTYGTLGGIVVFLVWLWITNTMILLGAELNAEIERGRQIQAGHPAEREPFLTPRSYPN